MGYIQKNLMAGEKVVYEAKQHGIVYVGPFFVALLAFFVVFIPMDPLAILCICMLFFTIAFGWAMSIYGGRQYVVTTHRLIFKRGIINRNSFELLLRKCEGIQVDQSILGRLLDYGTVNVTTGEATNSYMYISHPLAFTTKIHEQINNLKDI
jgi:uncharacterized membrane protein YdbT with pleckstrin-like domain